MIEVYATPYRGKPEVLAVGVEGAEVLLRHGDNGRWVRLRPSTACRLAELLTQGAAEARGARRPKTDEEQEASHGRVEMAKAEPVSGEPRPTPPTLTSRGDGESLAPMTIGEAEEYADPIGLRITEEATALIKGCDHPTSQVVTFMSGVVTCQVCSLVIFNPDDYPSS